MNGKVDAAKVGVPVGDKECVNVRVSLTGMLPVTPAADTLGEDKVSVVPEMPVTVSGVSILSASVTMSPT